MLKFSETPFNSQTQVYTEEALVYIDEDCEHLGAVVKMHYNPLFLDPNKAQDVLDRVVQDVAQTMQEDFLPNKAN